MSETGVSVRQPIRLVHVIHGLRRGGLENGVVNLCRGLGEEFVQGVCCLSERGELADRLPTAVPVWDLQRGRHDLGVWVRLARLLRQWQPDIIHSRNWNAWLDSLMGWWLAGRPGRLLWSFHGFTTDTTMPWRRRYASLQLARMTPHLLAVCHDSAVRFGTETGIDPKRFAILYNGVDVDRFQPNRTGVSLRNMLGLPERARLVVTVASLVPVKDHAGYLRGIAAMRSQLPAETYFLWIGSGSEQTALLTLRDELGLTDCVRLLGQRDDVPALLTSCDIFVLPSVLEGMSNAIIEAMACGLPVVARAVGGNVEIVVDGETGILVPAHEPALLVQAVSQLLHDGELCRVLGEQGRARVVEHFSLTAMMRNYAAFYRAVR